MKLLIAAALAVVASAPASAAPTRYLGETFDCHFAKVGHVVINTREPGATMTVNDKQFPASEGSSFFYATDNPDVTVAFGPNMRWWSFGDYGAKTLCKRAQNSR